MRPRQGPRHAGLRLMASWALPEMRLGRLQLHADPENVASQRVAERAGFTREGALRAFNDRGDGARADVVRQSSWSCRRRTESRGPARRRAGGGTPPTWEDLA